MPIFFLYKVGLIPFAHWYLKVQGDDERPNGVGFEKLVAIPLN
jgi:hypothetical protein